MCSIYQGHEGRAMRHNCVFFGLGEFLGFIQEWV